MDLVKPNAGNGYDICIPRDWQPSIQPLSLSEAERRLKKLRRHKTLSNAQKRRVVELENLIRLF